MLWEVHAAFLIRQAELRRRLSQLSFDDSTRQRIACCSNGSVAHCFSWELTQHQCPAGRPACLAHETAANSTPSMMPG